jgi:hypothetical protein
MYTVVNLFFIFHLAFCVNFSLFKVSLTIQNVLNVGFSA